MSWPTPDRWMLTEDATGQEVQVGDILGLDGKRFRVTYLEPPHREGTAGRVSATRGTAKRSKSVPVRYYAHVWGCTFKLRDAAEPDDDDGPDESDVADALAAMLDGKASELGRLRASHDDDGASDPEITVRIAGRTFRLVVQEVR